MSEWKTYTIDEIGEVISGGTPSSSVQEYWDGDIVWITPFDLSKIKYGKIRTSSRKITEKGLNNSSANIIPQNNIVISSRAPIGYCAVSTSDYCTNQGCKSIRLKIGFDSVFQYYNLIFNINKIKQKGEGTTFAEISKNALEKIKLPCPSLSHQRKIARILTTVDNIIEKTEAAIAKYKASKQGMMHDLFTRGIDVNTGKLRPAFDDAPKLYKESEQGMIPKEWEVVKLGDVISVSSGEGLTQNNIKPGIYPVYGGNGINGFHSEYLFKEERLIIGRVGEYCGSACITKPFSWVTDNALIVTRLEKEFNLKYWAAFLNYIDLNLVAFAAAQPVITGGIINAIEIAKIPFNEQNIISKKLHSIDQKLQIEQSALSKYLKIKQGLMQDLLTGKKEVTPAAEDFDSEQ